MNPQDNYSPSPLTPGLAPAGPNPAPNMPSQNLSTDPLVMASAANNNYNAAPATPPASPNSMPAFNTAPASSPADNPSSTAGGPADANAAPGINGAPVVNDMANTSAAPTQSSASSPSPAPAQPFSPFNNTNPTLDQQTPGTSPKSGSGHRTLNLILGLLTVVFAVAAIIFCILWMQAPKNNNSNQGNSGNSGNSTDQDNNDDQNQPSGDQSKTETILSCRLGGDLPNLGEGMTAEGEMPTAMGISIEARYRNDEIQSLAMGTEMTFATNEAAAATLESMRTEFEQQAATYREQYGLNVAMSIEQFNNTVSSVVSADGNDLRTNPAYGVAFGLYPDIESNDPTTVSPENPPDTSLSALRTLYQGNGMTCEEKQAEITEE